jgi:hypothetical protein
MPLALLVHAIIDSEIIDSKPCGDLHCVLLAPLLLEMIRVVMKPVPLASGNTCDWSTLVT